MLQMNLRRLCRKYGITMSELAKRSSIPQPSLSRYATGRSDITLRQLGRIALALNVGLGELVRDGTITHLYREKIRRQEAKSRNHDKAWVTRVLSGLQAHYASVRR